MKEAKIVQEFKTGSDNFEVYLPLLENKKVGVVTNQSGILSRKIHLVDFLMDEKINILKIAIKIIGIKAVSFIFETA